jgi:hypothetical protein
MATYTSTLPDHLLKDLAKASKDLKLPKNKIIEKALHLFLDEIKKAKYAKSFQRASKDKEIMAIAEEGMADYFEMLKKYDAE